MSFCPGGHDLLPPNARWIIHSAYLVNPEFRNKQVYKNLMLILLNGGNFSLTVLVHNMFLISFERMCVRGSTHHKELAEPTRLVVSPTNKTHQTTPQPKSRSPKEVPPRHPVVLHQSFQCPNWRSHFEGLPLPDSVDIFFTMTSQQKNSGSTEKEVATQLPKKALPNHWFLCIRYVTNPQLLKHTSLSQFEGQFNSSETNYSIPFERWCNRLSFLSNSCFISSRILHKPFERLFQLICWGFMRPLGYNLSRLRIWLERWCWTDATPSHPEVCPNVSI